MLKILPETASTSHKDDRLRSRRIEIGARRQMRNIVSPKFLRAPGLKLFASHLIRLHSVDNRISDAGVAMGEKSGEEVVPLSC